MQDPNIALAILSTKAQNPEAKFDKLFPKLYNVKLWLMAYESIAANPGNMTAGVDGTTIDGMSMELIESTIADLKASRYKPKPVRRIYIEKANGKKRPIGIPCFRDKLLQTVVRLILEAIYEPIFSDASHGFRPNRSCHTALEQVKRIRGVKWWIEGDISGFFDNLNHDTLLGILSKRIMDKRFLLLIQQFLRAGYMEDWKYNQTYSGTPQGGNLSPLLSNIYLNELDQAMSKKAAEFNRGITRRKTEEYVALCQRIRRAKKKARKTGDWKEYKALKKQQLSIPATDPFDPEFRRMYYVRYADDFLVGISGSKADAVAIKDWLAEFLRTELQLELSAEKTLITNSRDRVRFLGYDIKRWKGAKVLRFPTRRGIATKRTTTETLTLLMSKDKVQAFVRTYGNPNGWRGERRKELLRYSELEILMIYNAEIRGFLGYYALANNFTTVASRILWMTTTSFLKTLAAKHKSTIKKVAKRIKKGPARYVISQQVKNGTIKEYELIASTKQLERKMVTYAQVDQIPNTMVFRGHTELGQRLMAQKCEWCGTEEGTMEVHHVRRLKDLKGKAEWEIQMLARRRKTMVLCKQCHDDLHAGRLSATKKQR